MKSRIKKIIVLSIFTLLTSLTLSAQNKLLNYERLDGQWEFYLEKNPRQVFDIVSSNGKPDTMQQVPGFWNKDIKELTGSSVPETYGCYRKVINNLNPKISYALLMKDAPGTSCAVFINQKMVFVNGDPFAMINKDPYSRHPSKIKPIYCSFEPDKNGEVEIVFLVSNYFYRKSGLWDAIYFGPQKNIFRLNTIIMAFNTIIMGVLVFIFLLNLFQFFINRKRKEYLYLSLISIICALRISTASYASLAYLFPIMIGEVKIKLEFLMLWAVPVCILQMLTLIYPVKTQYIGFKWFKEKYIRYTIIFGNIAMGLASVFLPAYFSNRLVMPLQIGLGVTAIYIMTLVVINVVRKSRHCNYYLASCFTLLIGGIVDIIYSNTKSLLPISLLPFFIAIFIFIQIFLLATIQNDIYKETESISINLQKLNEAYLRFVPREFLKLLSKDSITKIELGDHSSIEMTIMFSKLNIYSINNTMTPEEHFSIFNDYLKTISPIITIHNGFVSKFLSGGFMALFPKSEVDSIKSALQIISYSDEMNKIYNNQKHMIKIVPRIGIHYGKMIIGTIGEENRLDDTVISDTVNTVSRIESVCENLDKQLIISHSLHERLPNTEEKFFNLTELEAMTVKGKQKPLQLYECTSLNGEI
ncbi:MAG: adenylate/guanylate cyclase domain-containing protein [Treponema sp.]|nr:adenylate/guanylate cyclase domain-containing protein [Treponema sp.]